MAAIANDWLEPLSEEFKKPYYKELYLKVQDEYRNHQVFPAPSDLFSAYELTELKNVKVVILGQDPYHQKGQAHGMCFSVNPGVKIPPSLENIFRELGDELGCYLPDNGYLMPWAKQGVFLLNTVMTVEDSRPLAHANKGWEVFTDRAIKRISDRETPAVFLLWGRNARSKASLIDRSKHLVLEAAHPSPLSAYHGFFGCGHFARANAFLKENGMEPVDWQIRNLGHVQ